MYRRRKPIILIGGISVPGSVTFITRSFVNSPILNEYFVFIPLDASRSRGLGKRAKLTATNIAYGIRDYCRWLNLLIRYRPDIAHYPVTSWWNFPKSMLFLLTAKVFRCRTIGHLHGGAFDRFWNKLPKVCKLVGLTALNSLDGLIILMRRWRNLITESPRYRLFILPDPIDKNFADQEFSRPFQAEEVTLLFVGAIGERKGVPTLLQAMNRVVAKSPNVHLILLGPEEHSGDHNEMKKLASQLLPDGCYKFVGPVYDKRKIEFFSQSDVFVFPSNYESFGVVIAEAMAASRPIVCTPVGMAPEYLEHGVSALFVRRRDPDDLAEKTEWMISHPQQAIEMGKKARKIFEEKLSQDRIMIKLRRIYMTLLKFREEH